MSSSKKLTIALAAVAALVPAAAPAHGQVINENRPGNYGTCVAYEAMFGDEPVREFTQNSSPLTAFLKDDEIRTVGPRHPDDQSIGCRPEG